MSSAIDRPSQERLNTLPLWAGDYIRDLEWELSWREQSERGVSGAELTRLGTAVARADGRLFRNSEMPTASRRSR